MRREHGRIVLLTFSDCRVVKGDRLLFDPAWGWYDMAAGSRIDSVFHGAADKDAYEEIPSVPRERTIKRSADAATRQLEGLYAGVREAREHGAGSGDLAAIVEAARADHPRDWLLTLEILEVLTRQGHRGAGWHARSAIGSRRVRPPSPDKRRLIENGLRLLGSEAG